MQLEVGYRIIQAPRFAITSDWPGRVRLNSGVTEDDGKFFPKPDWRSPTEAELALLIDESPRASFPSDALCLFAITEHLRSRWWTLAEAGMGSPDAGGDWFTGYARGLGEFARFKGLPLPPSCSFTVAISSAGQPSTRIDTGSAVPRLAGLDFNVALEAASPRTRVLGGLNLGDEPASIIFVNLPPVRLAVGRRFLGRSLEYPVVQLALKPGDGFWLPSEGMLFDGYTVDREEIEIMLMMSCIE